jgi:outer membrane protein assembly factor BamB
MTSRKLIVTALLACLAAVIFAASLDVAAAAEPGLDPLDWPMWRGPWQNNTSPETGLPDQWNPRGGPGSNVIWQSEALAGRSTPIIMDGRLYTIVRHKPDTPEEAEKIVCADAATGNVLWEHIFNVYLTEVPNTRVGWSSVVGDPETGRVYAFGVCGYFCCLEGESGQLVWSRSLQEEFGTISTYGGRTNFPLVFEDTVIVSAVVVGWGDTPQWGIMSKPAHRFMGFDKATGELRWLGGTRLIPYDTTYSTPTITAIGGKAQMIFASGDGGVWALEPRTGRQIWSYELSHHGINTPPLVVGNMVYAGHSEENSVGATMGAVVALDASKLTSAAGGTVPSPAEVWKKYEVMNGRAGPIMVENNLWVVEDGAKLLVFDPKTGEQLARKALGTMQRSTPLFADGKVYITEANGSAWILRPNGSQVEQVHRLRLGRQSCDASPIVSHGRVYISTSQYMYCIGKEDYKPSDVALAAKAPPLDESPVTENPEPAHVQVVPFDVLLSPGEKQAYRVRLYNNRGQFLREAPSGEVEFKVNGPGAISSEGTYSAPTGDAHEAALVTCSVAGLEGNAKIRVVPPLPWKWDFNQITDVPLTWIGGRVRFVLRDVDGERVMVKVDTIPTRPGKPDTKLGTRSYLSMGPPDLSNYTIEADLRLSEKEGKLPDAGLSNSRYTMTFLGEGQRVVIDSWSSHDYRHHAIVPMPLEAGKWYSVKFSVVPGEDKAVARGKVWPRGEPEPEGWTLEMTDTVPNTEGSPGLFGNTGNAEFFIDNISVTPNEP